MSFPKTKKIAVIGASGYTGAELVRLLLNHPHVDISALTADRHAGEAMSDAYPQLYGCGLPDLVTLSAVDWTEIEAAFCCLPHGVSQELIAGLPDALTVIDLSADFRLRDPDVYAQWYGQPHQAVELQKQAVYGLSEWYREEIAAARLIACPGCYPTAANLALFPLLQTGLIESGNIIIDAKSGVSGAGRALRQGSLFCEANENVMAYGIGAHRHLPEITQTLTQAANEDVQPIFTPHLVPMQRGILATMYVHMAGKAQLSDLRDALESAYEESAFVHLLPEGMPPATQQVKGTNRCHLNLFESGISGQAVIVSAIDNLVKGASGQAVQNFNLRFGYPESMALEGSSLFP